VTAIAGGYLLPPRSSCVIDAELFTAEVDEATALRDRGLAGESWDRFERALGRWTAEPLAEDRYADWAQPYRRHLQQAHLRALEGSAAAALALGNAVLALQRAEQAVATEPLRESAHLLRLEALAAAGNPAAAAEAFAAFRRQLAEEMGLDPSPRAQALHQRLLRGEVRQPASPASSPTGRSPAAGAPPDLPFVGRDRELALVLRTVARSGVAVVEGVSGAGKSRLLAEVGRGAGLPVVSARAFLAERDEAWGLARHLLRDLLALDVSAGRNLPERMAFALADVVPELEEVRRIPSLSIEPDSRRALAMEAALRLTGAALGRGVLLLDDLQWADASSLALVDRLRFRLPDVGLVLAFRPEEVGAHDPLHALVDRVADSAGAVRLRVGPLDAAALRRIADDAVAEALAVHTDRTPMAVLEVVRALARQGVLARRDDGRWASAVPDAARRVPDAGRAGQRRAIQVRATAQPPRARDVLGLLALLGRETPARVLADALGTGQREVLADLDRLAQAGLVRLGGRGWAPAHDLIGESVAADMEAPTRGRLHEALARALSADDADAAEVARHLAGAGDVEEAARLFAAAARNRLERYADEEARQLATTGLALGVRAPLQAELLEARAEGRARSGDLAGAGEDLRSALRSGIPRPDRARLLARHARLAAGAEDLAHAAELVRLALTETCGDPRATAAALYAGSIIDMNTDRPERARQRSDEALRLFEQVGDARGVADILDARAMAVFLDGRNHEAAAAFDRVARLFLDAGDLLRVVTPRSTRGHCLVFMGRPQEALGESEQAVDLARTLGWSEGISYALWHRSEALSAVGRVEEALADAGEAVDVAERLGHRSWVVAGHRALGVALQAAGRLSAAEQAFCRALELARHWPLFGSWACARIALIRVARGDLAGAAPYVARALAEGPPLAHYEARLAAAELAAARHDGDAPLLARNALVRAQEGGHLVAVPRLTELARAVPGRAS
jgi:tetratricopeptide (TPR) repeat protein